jgi:hypothetical protein
MRKRRYETIAPAGKGSHISGARLTVTECLAKRSDLKPEGSIVDTGIRPYALKQFVLADDLASTFHQNNENIERSGAERERSSGSLEHSSRYK